MAQELVAGAVGLQRFDSLLVREEARLFSFLASHGRVHQTGFASVADLGEEILGLRARTVVNRRRLHRIFSASREAEEAFLAGRLTQCQLLALAPLLDGEDAVAWIERTSGLSVREIRRLVREEIAHRAEKPIEVDGQEGRTVTFDAPVEFHAALQETFAITRALLGYESPQYRCIEAILAETGHAGRGEVEQRPTRGIGRPVEPLRLRPRAAYCRAEAEAEARDLLAELRGFLAEIGALMDRGEPQDPFDAVDRLRQVSRLRAPLQILFGRILHSLEQTGSLARLGDLDLRHFAEEVLHLSERTARNRVAEARIFENSPSIREAYGRGEIGIVAAHLVYHASSERRAPAFLDRAREVTVRQLEREVRLLKRLQSCDRSLAVRFRGPFPIAGLEKALVEFLCGKEERVCGRRSMQPYLWPRKKLNRAMRRRGLVPPQGRGEGEAGRETEDPALDTGLMDRLEFLVELVMMIGWDEPVEQVQTFARGAREKKVTIWLPEEVASDLEAAIGTIRDRAGQWIPVWVAMTVLLAQARAEWEKLEGMRRPKGGNVLRRDGWRCRAPGCRSRRALEVHHIRFRSQGGSEKASNKITLCATHHRRLVHEGRIRLTGEALHALEWELGRRPGHAPLLRLRGEKRME